MAEPRASNPVDSVVTPSKCPMGERPRSSDIVETSEQSIVERELLGSSEASSKVSMYRTDKKLQLSRMRKEFKQIFQMDFCSMCITVRKHKISGTICWLPSSQAIVCLRVCNGWPCITDSQYRNDAPAMLTVFHVFEVTFCTVSRVDTHIIPFQRANFLLLILQIWQSVKGLSKKISCPASVAGFVVNP